MPGRAKKRAMKDFGKAQESSHGMNPAV
jgi:hypothetical protein